MLSGRAIHRFASTPSTMIEAATLASGGAPHGTLVIADTQTAGQGRHGHAWHSEPGTGLYLSLILRPALGMEALLALTLAAGLAARSAISDTTGFTCDLRWPNDLMHGDRKLGGILLQSQQGAVIAGFGINTGHATFPQSLPTPPFRSE